MIPRAVTLAVVEEELGPAQGWAHRAGVELEWHPDGLVIRAVFAQPETGERFYLLGRLDGYKALPPAWNFCDADWGSPGVKRNYPARPSLPGNVGSIFHTNPVICAPFNRLAYTEEGGPHGDWGGPAQWLNVKGNVYAVTLADMLAVVARDLNYSRGRMA